MKSTVEDKIVIFKYSVIIGLMIGIRVKSRNTLPMQRLRRYLNRYLYFMLNKLHY